jgi:hypothetical protein
MTSRNDFIDPRVGLCAECRHADIIRSSRSTFYRCRLSFTDPRFPKYPQLPVLACEGFEPRGEPTERLS